MIVVDALFWMLIGYAGLGLLFLRWLIQIYDTRKSGESKVSPLFWVISLGGFSALLAYNIFFLKDLVNAVGAVFGIGVSIFNVFIFKKRAST